MARSFQLFLNSAGPTFTVSMDAMTNDPVGHAWIGMAAADGSARTIGFWPDAWYSGIAGPGKLHSEDPHAGEQNHSFSAQVSKEDLERTLDVIAAFDNSTYSLLVRNCADFAEQMWLAATGTYAYPNTDEELDQLVWTPAAIGAAAEERKELKAQADKTKSGGR
ncbi:MAG: hypothetical protein KGQ66_18410 [Acidobacteriota bacterium]|nr:hypothetical protein [Acidobacteriota bacterium]